MRVRQKKTRNSRNIFIAFLLNLTFSVIEFVGGLITNSVSIMSDSIHDLGDALSIAISYVLERKAEGEPDSKYTFGYTRYSVLGGLITSTFLLIGSVVMIYSAIIRIFNPIKVNYDGMIVFAVIGLFVNGLGAFVTSKGNGINEKTVSLHMLEDVLGWAAVLIASIVMKSFDILILDPILSICISIYVLFHVVKNYKKIFEIFLQKAPDNVDLQTLKDSIVIGSKNIRNIHHIHVWFLDDTNMCVSMHVVLKKDISTSDIIDVQRYIEKKLIRYNFAHITVQTEFEESQCIAPNCSIEFSDSFCTCCHNLNQTERSKQVELKTSQIKI